MALDKYKVDDLLVDFVVRNQDDLTLNQKENPALYESVMSALSILAKRFGSGKAPAATTAAPVVTPEPVVSQPLAPPPTYSSNPLNFELGDVFFRKDSSGKKLYINHIDSDKNIVKVGFLEQPDDFLDFNLNEVLYNFDRQKWIKTGNKFMPFPKQNPPLTSDFIVGDVFYHVDHKDIKYYIHSIDEQENFVLVGSVDGSFSGTTRYDLDEANRLVRNGTWVFNGEIFNIPSSKITFKEGDIFISEVNKTEMIISKINNDDVDLSYASAPDVVFKTAKKDDVQSLFDTGMWTITGNINNKSATMLPIKLGDVISDFKLKQDFFVRYINPYTDEIHLAELDEPNITVHKYSYSDTMAYLNNRRFVIKPKSVAKSAPPPPAPKSTVAAAAKKTAAKTKRAVSPEEKEILEAIKTLKPLVEFDADVQIEIDALNKKLQDLRNKKD